MELWHVIAALVSAALHAGWNAAVKVDRRSGELLTAQMAMAALLVMPGLLWTGLPATAAWPWIVASTCSNIIGMIALIKTYELAGFGLGYPVIRALSVMLVVPLTAYLARESLSPFGLAGVALMALSLLSLAIGNKGQHAVPRAALMWIAIAGVALAVTVTFDAKGVRAAGSPWSYGFVVSITNALVMLGRQRLAGHRPMRLLRDHIAKALPIAVCSVTSYQLILLVWSVAPVAPSAALRDTSAVFAILIAVFWLKEPMTRARLGAVALAAAAVPLLRFA
jgi:drug/metabolite transporter (DMT)-like permease